MNEEPQGVLPNVPGETKEAEAIRRLTDEAVAALNRGDVEAGVALHTSDALVLAPLRPAEIGASAIRASLESLFKQYSVCESRTLEEVQVHGNWAFTRGSYRSVLTPKNAGSVVEESGKYVEILRQDATGAWKYFRSIWNSDG